MSLKDIVGLEYNENKQEGASTWSTWGKLPFYKRKKCFTNLYGFSLNGECVKELLEPLSISVFMG